MTPRAPWALLSRTPAAAAVVALVLVGGCSESAPERPAPTGQVPEWTATPPATGPALGLSVTSRELTDPAFVELLRGGVTSLTPEYEMKPGHVFAVRDAPDFSGADAIVAFAHDRGMVVRGHTLVWHRNLPDWVESLPAGAESEAALTEIISATVQHFPADVVTGWDVLNEIFDDDGQLRPSPWLDKIGPDYPLVALRAFDEVRAPGVRGFVNEYGAERDTAKARAVLDLVGRARAAGVAVDGVGLQMHATASWPGPAEGVADVLRVVGEAGVAVEVTEMTVDDPDPQVRAGLLAQYAAVCGSAPGCERVTLWGTADGSNELSVPELDGALTAAAAGATRSPASRSRVAGERGPVR